MSETQVTAAVLPEEVVVADRRLDDRYGQATEDALSAAFERDRLRWEWTRCPNGPMLSYAEYGRQVKRATNTVRDSALAYESMESATTADSIDCGYDHQRYVTTAPAPTQEQTKAHAKAKRKVRLGEVRAFIVEAIASLWGKAENTVQGNSTYTPHKRTILARAQAELSLDDEVDEDELKQDIYAIASEVHAEYKRDEARAARAKKWMAKNRGVTPAEITDAVARKQVEHIHDQAEKAGISYEKAEKAAKEFDWKWAESERIQNERLRQARKAILNLSQAASELHRAAKRVVKAVEVIESEGIEMSADERAVFGDDIQKAEAAIRLARAALLGSSGTDWDAAMESLTGGAR